MDRPQVLPADPRQSRADPSAGRESCVGFTLVEMLVVLVLVSFVTLLLSQALTQVSRIERSLTGAQLDGVITAVRVAWLRASVEAMLPMPRESNDRFEGNERLVTGLSTDAAAMPIVGLAKVTLSLTFDPKRGATDLKLSTSMPEAITGMENSNIQPKAIALLSWQGNSGRFRYMDKQGTWHEKWPVDALASAPLPTAMSIETGLDEAPQIVVALRVSPLNLPSRKLLETL